MTSNITVTMSGALYDKIVVVLRKLQADNTEMVEGKVVPWTRCTVCGCTIRKHSSEYRSRGDDHCLREGCWMADVDYLLEELLK